MNFYIVGKAHLVFDLIRKLAFKELMLTWDRIEDGRDSDWWTLNLIVNNRQN